MNQNKWINRLAKLEWQLNKDLPEMDHQAFSRFASQVLAAARVKDARGRKRKSVQ